MEEDKQQQTRLTHGEIHRALINQFGVLQRQLSQSGGQVQTMAGVDRGLRLAQTLPTCRIRTDSARAWPKVRGKRGRLQRVKFTASMVISAAWKC